MNKSAEQAKLVQDALRAGKKVAIAVPKLRLFERVAEGMIPEDLPIKRKQPGLVAFKNGAILTMINATDRNASRGMRPSLAFYYEMMFDPSFSAVERYRAQEMLEEFRSRRETELHELELP